MAPFAVGEGSIVNEVLFKYDDFGQLTDDYQAHSGAVDTGTTPKVQYGYVDGTSNTTRMTTMTYPDGRVLTYDYGTADSTDDAASRVFALVDDDMASTHLAEYQYLGLKTFVEVDYTEPELEYTLIGVGGGTNPDTGDIYQGLDRFGRIIDAYWYDYGSSTDAARIKYGYDRVGNRTYRLDSVAASLGKGFSELYEHDGIHRLASLDRGTLNAENGAITSPQFAECWSLDETGNWSNFRQDDDGDNVWNLNQNRTANKVNEISDITESAGPSWATPAYSKAGNMTTIPQPTNPTKTYTATYDAWNRLVQVVDSATSDPVATYQYDGAKRRITQGEYASGVFLRTRHLYYTEPSKWQVVEERVDSSTSANRQFVWGERYVDDLVLRDRDTTLDGELDERLYGLQDANWNAMGLANSTGSVLERFCYTAYGTPTFLTPTYIPNSVSSHGWETLYSGYRWDEMAQMCHVRNRIYNARLGTWIQRDPVFATHAVDLYLYAESRPIVITDPTGEFILTAAILVGLTWTELAALAALLGLTIAGLIALAQSGPIAIPIDVPWIECRRRRPTCRDRHPAWPECPQGRMTSPSLVAEAWLRLSCPNNANIHVTECFVVPNIQPACGSAIAHDFRTVAGIILRR